eukprot:scaffold54682_cov69-Cyclotella_meneghiniana.AAC.1
MALIPAGPGLGASCQFLGRIRGGLRLMDEKEVVVYQRCSVMMETLLSYFFLCHGFCLALLKEKDFLAGGIKDFLVPSSAPGVPKQYYTDIRYYLNHVRRRSIQQCLEWQLQPAPTFICNCRKSDPKCGASQCTPPILLGSLQLHLPHTNLNNPPPNCVRTPPEASTLQSKLDAESIHVNATEEDVTIALEFAQDA